MKSDTETMIKALRIIAAQDGDNTVRAAIAEVADRLEQQQERIRRLEDAGNDLYACFSSAYGENHPAKRGWRAAKEAKP